MDDAIAEKPSPSVFRVLIIDDSRATRLVIRTFMREFGYETEEAPDGSEAMKFFAAGKSVDLIICDWEMPVMSGIEFVRAFRGSDSASAQTTPIVMSTTLNAVEKISEALEAGATDYIMKPFTKEIFAAKLDLLGIEHK
jgi:two-component system chemotaxis response regulator CheY